MTRETGEKKNTATSSKREKTLFVLLFLGFVTFFIPSKYALPLMIYRAWQVLILGVAAFVVVLYLSRKRISIPWALLMTCFTLCLPLPWIAGSGDGSFTTMAIRYCQCAGFVTLLELGMRKNAALCLRAFIYAGAFVCLLHFISFFIYRDVVGGMLNGYVQTELGRVKETKQNWYFLTYDNASIFYFLPTAAIAWFYAIRYDRRFFVVAALTTAAALIMYVYKTSATALVSMAIFLIGVVLSLGMNHRCRVKGTSQSRVAWPKARIALVAGTLFAIALVAMVGNSMLDQIAALFGKTASFSGRDKIWPASIDWILQSPFIGYGVEQEATSAMKIGQSHCHNIVLQLFYDGGIFAFASYYAALWRLSRCSKQAPFDPALAILSFAIFAFFVSAGMDWTIRLPYSLILFYAWAAYAPGDTSIFSMVRNPNNAPCVKDLHANANCARRMRTPDSTEKAGCR